MEPVVVLVAGGHGVATSLWCATPDAVLVRYDLAGLGSGVVRRWVDGALEVLELEHGCVSCTLRHDLLPLLDALGGHVIVDLDPALEPEAVCLALHSRPVRVQAVVTAVDASTWLAEATGDEELVSDVAGDERTLAQVVVGRTEFADVLVVVGEASAELDAVLDRLSPGVPRVSPAELPAVELKRVERFDQVTGSLLGGAPLEPAGDIGVVHFVASRPFHPMRLHIALDVLLDGVVRSRGRVWLVSQPDALLWLESAGGGLHMGEIGERTGGGQEIVVITRKAAEFEITSALREALVTDEEWALADELDFVDPFAEHEMEEL
ncbi:MAG: cobalamin biosynthesis protein CobW [Saccharothrix sp.]|nr:cobalamin biosynthesis protein CobW [Saccharothrix sp.]